MSKPGHNSKNAPKAEKAAPASVGDDINPATAGRLRAFVERIERLEEEKRQVGSDIKDIYAEAKSTGFDTKVLRKIVAMRKQDADERREHEEVLETYLRALGMA